MKRRKNRIALRSLLSNGTIFCVNYHEEAAAYVPEKLALYGKNTIQLTLAHDVCFMDIISP